MKDLSLGQLMRFALAGGIYLGALLVGFVEPRAELHAQTSGLIVGVATAVALLFGSILYSVHRALLLPVIRKVLMSKAGEKIDPIEFDLRRWSLSLDLGPQSLQTKLGLWADQIHFLYCAAWASLLAVVTGWLFGWTASSQTWLVLVAAALLLAVAVHYNWKYQEYELAAIEADEGRRAQLTSAFSRTPSGTLVPRRSASAEAQRR